MKNTYIIIFNITLLLLISNAIVAQTIDDICEDGKGISTDPDDPVNLEATTETWRLNNFDWKIQNPQNPQPIENQYFWFDDDDQNPLINPFTGPTDAEYYSYITAGDASDYHSENGWELMKVDFGKNKNGAESGFYPDLPHMMLYNRYTGTLRFFGAVRDPDENYSVVEVMLSIPKFSPTAIDDDNSDYQAGLNATNLLSIQGESIQPLDQPTTENSMSVFVDYSNSDQVFFWFDIPLAYDPCICQFKSQFDIDFKYVSVADIELTGDITGKIETVTSANKPDKAVKTFSRVLAAGISTVVAIKTGGAVINVKAYKELVDVFKDNVSDPDTKQSLEVLSTAVGCGGQQFVDIMAGNYKKLNGNFGSLSEKEQAKEVAKAKKIVESSTKFFSSLEKGCASSSSSASSSAISGRIEATGTVTTRVPIANDMIHMAVPGSKWDISLTERQSTLNQPYNKVVPAYPLYNERLGTFALLNTPEIAIKGGAVHCFSRSRVSGGGQVSLDNVVINSDLNWSLKLDEDLFYSFNPTLNLDPDQTSIQVRFIGTKDDDHFSSGQFINSASSCQNNNALASPLNLQASPDDGIFAFASPFLPINYVKSMPMRFSWRFTRTRVVAASMSNSTVQGIANSLGKQIDLSSMEDNVYIQFKIIAKSNDSDKDGNKNTVFQVLTFPIEFKSVSSDPNGSTVTGNYIQDIKDFDTDEDFNSNTDLYFEGPVYISADLSTSNGAKLRIYSLNGFIIEPGAELSPEIELITGPHLPRIEQPEATYNQLDAFCNNAGSAYQANEFSTAAYREMVEETDRYNEQARLKEMEKLRAVNLELTVYPNPTNKEFTVGFDIALSEVSVSVTDINGKSVYTQSFSGENTKVKLDATQLEAGVYFIDIRDANGKIGRQRLVKY